METLSLFALVIVGHELGHAVAARALGFRIKPFAGVHPLRFGIGVYVPQRRIDPGSDLLIALAGPMVNLAVCWPLWSVGAHGVAVLSALLAILNLIPFRRADGWRVRNAIRELREVHRG